MEDKNIAEINTGNPEKINNQVIVQESKLIGEVLF